MSKPMVVMEGGVIQDIIHGDIEMIDMDELAEIQGQELIEYAVAGLVCLVTPAARGWANQLHDAILQGVGDLRQRAAEDESQ